LIEPALRKAVEGALGASIERVARVSGGDINDAFELGLADGQRVFLKANSAAHPTLFPAEARGLAWLAEARCLRVPRVLAVSSGEAGQPGFLILEFLQSGSRRKSFDEELGRGLAELHRAGAPGFGLDHDNFIGRLVQRNQARPSWAEFYAEQRLGVQLRMAIDAGRAPAGLARGLERLMARLPEIVGPREPPARLHGDLWGGNLHVDDGGHPCLIDPAVYGGHREVDLAMMRLFGGFGERVFDAYAEAHPLPQGHRERVGLYQLYPLLVHVNLFGAGYVGQTRAVLERYF
jgi:fructosamine-3-kinase